ncbi:MAG: UvrD-helicase domain-containing protein [Candidatus Komeilibacteria bacterium]|nr:UvrD-helicase domain-containing protein [Candidatus Komeilibacteria bacterium]
MTYEDKLNLEQKKAVEHESGPLLIVAGAGTGKTTVICERINWLITKKNLEPNQILGLTFTEKAAAEMEERVDKALPYGYTDLWLSTFHGFAERILKEHGLDMGLTTEFKLLDQTAAWLLVRNNLDKFNLDYYRPLGNPNKFIHALLKHFSKAKDELIKPKDYLDYAESFRLDNDLRKDEPAFAKASAGREAAVDQMEIASEAKRLEEIANAYHVYQQLLLDNNYLDFGDLINYCYELFLKRPAILKKYQEQFKYILVDEFQDTNYAQYQLIKLLAKPKNNITVVGDDDQAIYKFRGASIANILEFKKDYPKCLEIFLTANYRTKQNILDAAYKFIQLNNPNRLEIQLKLKAKNSKLKTQNLKLTKELKAARTGKGIIQHLPGQTLADEVAAVVNKIGELYQKDKNHSFSDFAILVRANDQAKPFIEGLELAGVPYQFVASRGLYAKPLVLNLISFLRLLDNFHESDAMYRYLSLPVFNLEQSEIIKITHQAYKKSWTLFETAKQARYLLRLADNTMRSLDSALNLLDRYIARAKTEKTSRIIFDFLNEAGYLKYIDTLPELNKRQQFSYLGQFYKRIKTFEEINDDKSVKNFLNQLGLELESGEQGDLAPLSEDEGPEMVKVMTVHAAKGLEFKYVFLVNLVDQRFPTRERSEPILLPDALVKETVPEGDIHLQEERRLFYVGLTRAKDGVFLTSAEDYGGARKKKISVFLTDLGFKQTVGKAVKEEKLESIQRVETDAKKLIKEFLPARFSFTQIKDFQNCPRLYYYRYIVKVPLKGNAYFSFGSSIHLTLQKFFEEVKRRQGSAQADLFGHGQAAPAKNKLIVDLVKLEELLKLYEACWIGDWYKDKGQKEEYYKQGQEILKNFYQSRYLTEANPVFLERLFNFKLDAHTITGKIDRIDEVAGGFKIIDYKTGKAKVRLAAEDKEQLLIYQMAAQFIVTGTVKELAYYYLENDSQVPFLGTAAEIGKLQEKIIQTIEEIKNFDFVEYLKQHTVCDYCKDII